LVAPGVLALEKLLLTMAGPVLQLLRISHPGDSNRSQPNKREPITFILTTRKCSIRRGNSKRVEAAPDYRG
jgi:hypothetical protein